MRTLLWWPDYSIENYKL